ncbi:PQQ-binding-like beta-propeller repeat protein [Streptomyces sp. NPDC005402]|uniref:outer membrane protein assembly factor BamB family protein n=1 Tax=Streptomyces sp. NPDC005402 TaxID=3155338 RepID=UPI0033A82EEB
MHEDRAPESVWRHSRWRGSVRRLWTSPWETDLRDKPLALWATDDAVVDVRFDRVRAFRIPTGAPVWTWRPPGEEVVVVASSDVREGLGVVLHHDDGAADAGHIRVTALDLTTGEVAWSRPQRRDGLGPLTRRTGGTALAGGRIAAVDGLALRALDARTGEPAWEGTITDERVEKVSVLLAEPFVVRLDGRGARGRPRLRVARSDVALTPPEGYADFGGKLAVAGDTLAVELIPRDTPQRDDRHRDDRHRIGAFSLSSGRLLWTWQGGEVSSCTLLAHRGWFLVLHRRGDHLAVLDPADGRLVARRRLGGVGSDLLAAASGDVIATACRSHSTSRRLRVFRWR